MTPNVLYERRNEDRIPECFFLEPQVLTGAQYRYITGSSMLAQSHKWVGDEREFQEPAHMTVGNMRPGHSLYFQNQILFTRLDGSFLFMLVVTPAGDEKRVAMIKFDLFAFILDYVQRRDLQRRAKHNYHEKFDAPVICLSDSDSSDDEPDAKRGKKEKE